MRSQEKFHAKEVTFQIIIYRHLSSMGSYFLIKVDSYFLIKVDKHNNYILKIPFN